MGPRHREGPLINEPRDELGLEAVPRQKPDPAAAPGWRRLRQVDDLRLVFRWRPIQEAAKCEFFRENPSRYLTFFDRVF